MENETLLKDFIEKTGSVLHTLQNEIHSIKAEKQDALDLEKKSKLEAEFTKNRKEIDELKAEIETTKAILNQPNFTKSVENSENEVVMKGFEHFIKSGDETILKTLSAGNSPDGGYTIPAPIRRLIEARIFETSPVEKFANVVNITGSEYEFILDFDEAEANLATEMSRSSNTATPELGLGKIPVHVYDAEPQATQIILDDSGFNLESWLSNKVSDKISRKTSTDMVIGDGNNKISGILKASGLGATKILTDASVYSSSLVEVFKTGSDTAITPDNLLALVGKVKAQYRKNIFVSRETEAYLTQLKEDNKFIFDFSTAGTLSVKGMPVVIFEDVPAIGAGNNCLIVGDLKTAYTCVKRQGFNFTRDIYTTKGRVKFYISTRVGGGIEVADAIKVLKTAA